MDITERAQIKLSEKTNATQNVIRISIEWYDDADEEIEAASYTFAFDQIKTNDHIYDYGDFTIIIDQATMPFVKNSTIDYSNRKNFKLNNSYIAF